MYEIIVLARNCTPVHTLWIIFQVAKTCIGLLLILTELILTCLVCCWMTYKTRSYHNKFYRDNLHLLYLFLLYQSLLFFLYYLYFISPVQSIFILLFSDLVFLSIELVKINLCSWETYFEEDHIKINYLKIIYCI